MASATGNNTNASGARNKRLQFRDTREGVLPNSIMAYSRLTIDAAGKAALTQSGCKLLIEIDAAGTRVYLADSRNGQLVGGPDDLAKLGGIRSFVSRERKESHGVEVAKEVTQLAYKVKNNLALNDQGYQQPALDSSYGASVRPVLAVLDRLQVNYDKLLANTNQEQRAVYKQLLENFFQKIRFAYFSLITVLTKGESGKGYLNELLFDLGVPEYVHSKLIGQAFVLDRGQELMRVLFPSDPSKGLALTLKEWRDPGFLSKLGKLLLKNSGGVYALVKNDKFIRALTKLDGNVSLTDETNPVTAKLLKARVAVVPPVDDSSVVTDPGAKLRGGWKFPSPSMETPPGAIAALSSAIMRVYSANLQSVDLTGDYYAVIANGGVSKSSVTPTNNFYVQWSNAEDPDGPWADRIAGGTTESARVDFWRWVRMELRLSERGDAGKALALALQLTEGGKPDPTKVVSVKTGSPKAARDKDGKEIAGPAETIKIYGPLELPAGQLSTPPKTSGDGDLLRKLREEEIVPWKKFQEQVFPSKKKGKKVDAALSGNPLTRLTPEGAALVAEVKGLSPYVADRMRIWLRSFSDERLQKAAVRLANASFDELFISESQDADDDTDSVNDWAGDEEVEN